jgi:hypothetical protein
MTEGDRAAVDVDLALVHLQCADDGQRLRGEGFIQFYQINIVQGQPASFNALGMATIGPIPINSGGTPPAANETNRANGVSPSWAAFSADMTITPPRRRTSARSCPPSRTRLP